MSDHSANNNKSQTVMSLFQNNDIQKKCLT